MKFVVQKQTINQPVKKIGFKAAQKAAAKAGYQLLSVDKTRSISALGKYIEQDAIKSLAPAILVHAMHELKTGIDYCSSMLRQEKVQLTSEEADTTLRRLSDLIAQQISLAEKLQSAAILVGKTAPVQKALNPSFSPREVVTPVNVNIGIQSTGNIQVHEAVK